MFARIGQNSSRSQFEQVHTLAELCSATYRQEDKAFCGNQVCVRRALFGGAEWNRVYRVQRLGIALWDDTVSKLGKNCERCGHAMVWSRKYVKYTREEVLGIRERVVENIERNMK